MRHPVAARYAQALFETATSEGVVDDTREQLEFLGGLVTGSPELQQLMRNPDVDSPDKLQILERVTRGRWSPLVRSSLQAMMGMGRAELIPALAEAFAAMVEEDRGRLRVIVRTVHPLSEPTAQRLRKRLEQREGKQIEMEMEPAPELLGGVQIRLDHRVIDGSIRAQLDRLRQRLLSVRVHEDGAPQTA